MNLKTPWNEVTARCSYWSLCFNVCPFVFIDTTLSELTAFDTA
jgi:hypothetical protein